ncbi:unnamed protein product, partial [marine sediment metagenome]
PPQIQVDLSPLEELEQAIYVRDITLSPGITIMTDPEQLVAKVSVARVAKVEEVVTEEVVAEEAAEEAKEGEGEAEG